MRIIDNSTYDNDAALSIAQEMQEMIRGAGWSKSKVWSAFLRLTRRRTQVDTANRYIQFYHRHWQAVQLHLASVLWDHFNAGPAYGADEAVHCGQPT
eukprot:SAG31_NODE_7693_length_1615_cov_3.387203_1_plen_97_part_00